MEKIESKTIYFCDYFDCKEKSWLGKGFDWKMCEIVFGIHPKIIKQIEETNKYKSLAVIQQKFHFCRAHHDAKDTLFRIIAEEFRGSIPQDICTLAYFQQGLGCWVTIHDCLVYAPIKNFQFSYDIFEKIYRRFSNSVSLGFQSFLNQMIDELKHISCEAVL